MVHAVHEGRSSVQGGKAPREVSGQVGGTQKDVEKQHAGKLGGGSATQGRCKGFSSWRGGQWCGDAGKKQEVAEVQKTGWRPAERRRRAMRQLGCATRGGGVIGWWGGRGVRRCHAGGKRDLTQKKTGWHHPTGVCHARQRLGPCTTRCRPIISWWWECSTGRGGHSWVRRGGRWGEQGLDWMQGVRWVGGVGRAAAEARGRLSRQGATKSHREKQ